MHPLGWMLIPFTISMPITAARHFELANAVSLLLKLWAASLRTVSGRGLPGPNAFRD